MSQLIEIARHELAIILRTRRALVITALYLGAAILGGALYVWSVSFAETKAMEMFQNQGLDEEMARQNMTMAADKIYDEAAQLFGGVDELDEMANSLRKSVVLTAFFWFSLVLLPFMILFTSFDQLSSDLQARSLTYSILRVPRAVILLGKVAAHTVVFMVLTAFASLVLVLVASIMLETVSFGEQLLGLLRVWLLLIPFGLCYLGISVFSSASNTQPVPSLLTAIAIIIGLRVIGLFRYFENIEGYELLRHGQWVSPAAYHDNLWVAGFGGPATSSAAYLVFFALFTGLAILQLTRRDL